MSGAAVFAGGALLGPERTRGPLAIRDYYDLTKPGITRHVVSCAAAGYLLAAAGPMDWPRLAVFLTGTALVSGGTNALNQWWERDVDARMPRTRWRPAASGRIAPRAALRFGLAIGALGVALVAWRTNLLTAALAAFTLASYVLVYTPLKRRSTLNTLVGCVPGALPIFGGWTAVTGRPAPAAWALFGVLFLWQLPHTLSLVWLLRSDYRAGALVMPGVNDETGTRTAIKSAAYALALLAASLLLVPLGVTGRLYFAVALVLGVWLVACGALWAARPTPARARRLFVATIVYLPLLLLTMVGGKAAGL